MRSTTGIYNKNKRKQKVEKSFQGSRANDGGQTVSVKNTQYNRTDLIPGFLEARANGDVAVDKYLGELLEMFGRREIKMEDYVFFVVERSTEPVFREL